MCEYSQIQTYIRCDKENFKNRLMQFQSFLKDIGFCDNYIRDNFKDIEWIEEENGFVYSGCNLESKRFEYGNCAFNIRPLAAGLTPRISEDIKESWLELVLLFETEEIVCDYRTGKLKDGIKELIIKYMIDLSKYFNETGTYFTDEVTDGRPWEALIGAGDSIWAFDIAIVPPHLVGFYSDAPAEFIKQTVQDKHLYIRQGV